MKSIICHALELALILQLHRCINALWYYEWTNNKIFDVDVQAGETVLLEPSYPIVLESTGDQLVVGTGNVSGLAATHVNFMVTGDKEV